MGQPHQPSPLPIANDNHLHLLTDNDNHSHLTNRRGGRGAWGQRFVVVPPQILKKVNLRSAKFATVPQNFPKLSIFNLTRKQRKRNEENPVQVLVYIIFFCKKQKTGKITEKKRTEKAESVLIDRYAMRYILIFFR